MRRIQDLARDLAGKNHYVLVRYDTMHRRSWMDKVSAIKQERTFLLNHCEACQLISAVTSTEKLGGDMAELGVASGASAKLISDYAPSRALHLFDTFEGLPDVTEVDSPHFARGQFSSRVRRRSGVPRGQERPVLQGTISCHGGTREGQAVFVRASGCGSL
jgi:hypothetical protein